MARIELLSDQSVSRLQNSEDVAEDVFAKDYRRDRDDYSVAPELDSSISYLMNELGFDAQRAQPLERYFDFMSHIGDGGKILIGDRHITKAEDLLHIMQTEAGYKGGPIRYLGCYGVNSQVLKDLPSLIKQPVMVANGFVDIVNGGRVIVTESRIKSTSNATISMKNPWTWNYPF